jgi:uncharacterized RDD family membrane protein YckC
MEDGDIDYSRYSARELHEALAGIRRDLYPKNHANILKALGVQETPVEASPRVAEETPEPTVAGIPLGSRGARLGAALIDAIIIAAIVFPIEYAAGFWQVLMDATRNHELVPLGTSLPWLAFGLCVFVLVQGYPLVRDGQSWGKKVLSIKIVDGLGRKPSIGRLSVRCGVAIFAGMIPFVGRLASLVDVCLIFRTDKRCGHDLVAGTHVVQAGRAE